MAKRKKSEPPLVRREYTVEELKKLPTITKGHTDDLKVETPSYRVWLTRMTPEDGDHGWPVRYEDLVACGWVKCDAEGRPIPDKIDSITLVGRRWYRRGPGGTYHSVEIYVNGDFVHKVGLTSGYDRQYEETAAAWLHRNGYIARKNRKSAGYEVLHWYCKDRGIVFNSTVTDVAREKDL